MKDAKFNSYCVVFFDRENKCRQIIRPTEQFHGDWAGLVHTVTRGIYSHFEIQN